MLDKQADRDAGVALPAPGAAVPHDSQRRYVLMALTAYLLWGFSVFPFKWVAQVPALEVVAHRFLWSGIALGLYLWLAGRLGEVRAAAASPRLRRILPVSALLIGLNATIYVVGVVTDRVIETSFGYLLAPLVLVAVGGFVLGERINGAQKAALGLSCLACGVLALGLASVPWLGFAITASWASYTYVRKFAPIAAVPAFFLECLLIIPLALAVIATLELSGEGHFLQSTALSAQIVATAIVTATPLVLFAAANTRLTLVTMSQMQYVAPSIQFLLAIFVFHEPVEPVRLLGFALIALALAVFSLDMLRRERMGRRARPA